MGYCLLGLSIVAVVWLVWIFARPRPEFNIERMEQVDLLEGAAIIEQQRVGRERWRQAEVELPARPLTMEEQLSLESIQAARNPKVKIKRYWPEPTPKKDRYI